MMGNYHVRCGVGEKPEMETSEAYLSLLSLPDDFDKILSVMRSRGVSVSIILQNLAQLKALLRSSGSRSSATACAQKSPAHNQ